MFNILLVFGRFFLVSPYCCYVRIGILLLLLLLLLLLFSYELIAMF